MLVSFAYFLPACLLTAWLRTSYGACPAEATWSRAQFQLESKFGAGWYGNSNIATGTFFDGKTLSLAVGARFFSDVNAESGKGDNVGKVWVFPSNPASGVAHLSQEPAYEQIGTFNYIEGEQFGGVLQTLDANGDGIDDLAVGGSEWAAGGYDSKNEAGRAVLLQGGSKTMQQTWEFHGEEAHCGFGTALTAGDVN